HISILIDNDRKNRANYNLTFIDETTGWLSDGKKLFKTSDGGSTWLATNLEFEYGIGKVKFISQKLGWVTHGKDLFSVTTDGGVTWIKRKTEEMNYLRNQLFVDTLIGWSCFGDDTLRKTTDGGIHWNPVHWNPSQGYETFTFLDAMNGWIVTQRETMRTTDGGISWLTYPNHEYMYPRLVKFIDQNRGWIISYACNISRTTDGGKTWITFQKQTNDNEHENIEDFHFVSPTHGWVVGRYGLIKTTTDGGESWITVSSGSTGNLTQIAYLDTLRLWALGYETVLHTSNGGQTWLTLFQTPKDSSLRFTHISVTDSICVINCIYGSGYISFDGGKHWDKQNAPASIYRINLIDYFDRLNGWAVGASGTILHTSDCGITWEEQFSGTNKNLTKIKTFSKNCVILTGVEERYNNSINLLLYTTDGGVNWERMEEENLTLSISNARLHDRETPFGSYNVTESASGIITITNCKELKYEYRGEYSYTIGDVTWTLVRSQPSIYFKKTGMSLMQSYPLVVNRLNAMTFINERNGWIVGDGGTILYYGLPRK
ncbi:MAG: YCF48-related protein, partial [bacterium]|nr:YCF48-related protein [bacterium]